MHSNNLTFQPIKIIIILTILDPIYRTTKKKATIMTKWAMARMAQRSMPTATRLGHSRGAYR